MIQDARNNPMFDSIRIFAKGLYDYSLYETSRYEHCEGTEGLTDDECKEIVAEWEQQERDDYGHVVTSYFIR